MTLNPYKPVPWEAYTVVKMPARRRSYWPWIALFLAGLAIVTGGLLALVPIYEVMK